MLTGQVSRLSKLKKFIDQMIIDIIEPIDYCMSRLLRIPIIEETGFKVDGQLCKHYCNKSCSGTFYHSQRSDESDLITVRIDEKSIEYGEDDKFF